jgi:hypothetical protein
LDGRFTGQISENATAGIFRKSEKSYICSQWLQYVPGFLAQAAATSTGRMLPII